jgi:nuclear transport factor 2 (NTF2) superfamily protein
MLTQPEICPATSEKSVEIEMAEFQWKQQDKQKASLHFLVSIMLWCNEPILYTIW